jgi:hypothetical protein
MDTDRTRKRRRTGPNDDFTSSSGASTLPSPLQNRSLEFTRQHGRNRHFGQTSTSVAVDESFGQEDLDLPDHSLPWGGEFEDFPQPPEEEEPDVEEDEEEVSITTFYVVVYSLLILYYR